jgi:DNA-binding GntR family transcriptional regulator
MLVFQNAGYSQQVQDYGQKRLGPLKPGPGTLAQRTYVSLREAIISLHYSPGEHLRKSEICKSLGISRSPVSEAITRLTQERLVDVVPQAGTYVARFSMDEIQEGAFVREAIELAAIERLAKQITDAQLVKIRRNLRVQEALIVDQDFGGFYMLDRELHEILLAFTGFKKLAVIADAAWVNVDRARQLLLPIPGRVAETLHEHQQILQTLEARDPMAARQAMQTHLGRLILFLIPLEKDHPEFFMSA